jgi:hypothetical protein
VIGAHNRLALTLGEEQADRGERAVPNLLRSERPDLRTLRRRAQRQSRMAEGHREAAPRVLDGREHDGTLAAEGRPLTIRHIAGYPRILTAANKHNRF